MCMCVFNSRFGIWMKTGDICISNSGLFHLTRSSPVASFFPARDIMPLLFTAHWETNKEQEAWWGFEKLSLLLRGLVRQPWLSPHSQGMNKEKLTQSSSLGREAHCILKGAAASASVSPFPRRLERLLWYRWCFVVHWCHPSIWTAGALHIAPVSFSGLAHLLSWPLPPFLWMLSISLYWIQAPVLRGPLVFLLCILLYPVHTCLPGLFLHLPEAFSHEISHISWPLGHRCTGLSEQSPNMPSAVGPQREYISLCLLKQIWI